MAERYESVVDVRSREDFERAVRTVVASRARAAGHGDLTGEEPLAVLVQPLVDAESGGVLFGIDPVTGREDRLVVAAVAGGPDRLVSGEVEGSRYVLDHEGRCEARTTGDGGARLRRRRLRELARLAADTAAVFGSPQDVEWAVDRQGGLRLLQSRPVTAEPRGRPQGPVFGPGIVAETFPEPLQPLEVDLWVPPLRSALRTALRLAGTSPEDAVDRSPLMIEVGGRIAVDLDLMEPTARRPGVAERLDPRPRLRRLRASWRVGRLTAALPALARDVVESADEALGAVPDPQSLSDAQLAGLLHRVQRALTAVHAHEILMGLLVDADAPATTASSTALRVLAGARRTGLPDERIAASMPMVLALSVPRVGPGPDLPPDGGDLSGSAPDATDSEQAAVLREALRLRARWLQEAGARAAWELGGRRAAARTGGRPRPATGRAVASGR
jgi:hypothetical protein